VSRVIEPRRKALIRGSTREMSFSYEDGRAIIRSAPTQFWPADWKTPRIRIEEMDGRLRRVLGSFRTIAGSFPPSSTQTGVSDLAADAQTLWATGRDPMNVRWAMSGWEVRWSATAGRQTVVWTRSGEWPQARRAPRAISRKNDEDQAVCSEGLTMTALPVKRAEMTGPIKLWKG